MLLDVHAHPPAMWQMADAEGAVGPYIESMARFDLRAVVSQLRPGPGAPAGLAPWEKPHAGNDYTAVQVPDPDPAAVADLVNRWPDVRWVLAGGRYREVHDIGTRLWREARAWLDIARVQGPMDGIRALRDAIGVRRLLYGSNLPFILAQSPIMELGDARLTASEEADVRYRNAEAALGIALRTT